MGVRGAAGDAPSLVRAGGGSSVSLNVLAERLRGESTRMAVLRGIAYSTRSPLLRGGGPLAPLLAAATPSIISACAVLLRQSSRVLRVQVASTLTLLVGARAGGLDPTSLSAALVEGANSLSDGDLSLTSLILECSAASLSAAAEAGGAALTLLSSAVRDTLLPRCMHLACSPVLQGAAMSSTIALLRVCVTVKEAGASLIDPVVLSVGVAEAAAGRLLTTDPTGALDGASRGVMKQIISSASRVIAAIAASVDPAATRAIVSRFFTTCVAGGGDGSPLSTHALVLSLHILGEVAPLLDLATISPDAFTQLWALLDSPSEEVRNAAAWALGGAVAGAPEQGIPLLTSKLAGATAVAGGVEELRVAARALPYLILTALKEVPTRFAPLHPGGPTCTPQRQHPVGGAARAHRGWRPRPPHFRQLEG